MSIGEASVHRRTYTCLLLTIILMLGFVVQGAAEVRVLELKHRPAADLAATLEPLLGGESRLAVSGQRLILSGSSRELNELEKLVRQLDSPRQTLRLTVRQTADEVSAGSRVTMGTGIQWGESVGGQVTARGGRSLGTRAQAGEQFLMVLDGEEGFILVGQEVPFTSELAVVVGRHPVVGQRTELRKVSTGFRVRPTLVGESVWLEVAPQMMALEGGQGDAEMTFSTLVSSVQVPLGQWFSLGGHQEARDDVSRAILSRTAGVGNERREIFIRVDPVGGP